MEQRCLYSTCVPVGASAKIYLFPGSPATAGNSGRTAFAISRSILLVLRSYFIYSFLTKCKAVAINLTWDVRCICIVLNCYLFSNEILSCKHMLPLPRNEKQFNGNEFLKHECIWIIWGKHFIWFKTNRIWSISNNKTLYSA